MRIGVVTAGGDCPGLNAVIRAVVKKGILHYGDEFYGFTEGWKGLMEDDWIPLTLETTSGIIHRGGTILRSSRCDVRQDPNGFRRCIETVEKHGVEALVVLGGDGTQSASLVLTELGVNVVGVPKTIDNDLGGTDVCFGFDTAVATATEAIDRLHSTAEAHKRVMVIEVMGRDAGWIALTAGIAGGADVILIPEMPLDMEEVARILRYRWETGKMFAIVVVAEGVKLPPDLKIPGRSLADSLAVAIEKKTGYETRAVNIGHTQRGGTPTAFDRMLATRYGVAAINLVHQGHFGQLVVLKGQKISNIPLSVATEAPRRVGKEFQEMITDLQPLKAD